MAAADTQPLAGKRVVVTRAPEQAPQLTRRLTALGAEVISFPLLEFLPVEDTAEFDRALRQLDGFDWLLFTSQNAVEFFCKRCLKLGVSLENLAERVQVGAVGPATAKAAGNAGLPADCVARQPQGLGLAAELRQRVKGKRVLLPRSDHARGDLPAALRDAGAEVLEIVAYRTAAAGEGGAQTLQKIVRGGADVLILASPSALYRLKDLAGADGLRGLARTIAFAAIGPVTAEAIRREGLTVAILAKEPTSSGLADAIVKYYAASRQKRVIRR